jgi:hypothetical protein
MNIVGQVSILTDTASASTETLDHATINLDGVDAGGGIISGEIFSTLTLGTSLSVKQTGAFATVSGMDVVNRGSIAAGFAHGQLLINGPTTSTDFHGATFPVQNTFANQGVITVSNGERLTIASSVFTNSGSLSATTGGIVNLDAGSWTSTGKISEINASLNLAGNLTLAGIAGVSGSGGVVNFDGALALGGGTLNIGTGSSLTAIGLLGTIGGGSIH